MECGMVNFRLKIKTSLYVHARYECFDSSCSSFSLSPIQGTYQTVSRHH